MPLCLRIFRRRRHRHEEADRLMDGRLPEFLDRDLASSVPTLIAEQRPDGGWSSLRWSMMTTIGKGPVECDIFFRRAGIIIERLTEQAHLARQAFHGAVRDVNHSAECEVIAR